MIYPLDYVVQLTVNTALFVLILISLKVIFPFQITGKLSHGIFVCDILTLVLYRSYWFSILMAARFRFLKIYIFLQGLLE